MKTILAALLFLLPLLAHADSQPATYTVQGKHNVVHLVGTVHLLQDNEALPANITRSYADAKQLLLEIDTSSMDAMAVQETVMSLGMLSEEETLESKLDAATYNKLKAAAQTAGLDMMIVDHLRPWLAAMQLEEAMFMKIGLDPKSGVEMQLTKRAAQDHKPISGFETMDEQLNFFANLDEKTEMDFLTSTLDELKDIRREMSDLMNAWRQGDENSLMALMQKEMRGHEKFYNVLLTQRNKRWIGRLQSLLDNSNDNYLVAVGALHLVGNDGVVALLRRAGYKVTRD
jgi:uncharacterized protein YbaP (TraB family)